MLEALVRHLDADPGFSVVATASDGPQLVAQFERYRPDIVITDYAGPANNNLVGGTDPRVRNVISGNLGNGVHIKDGTSTGNQVLGNFIGTDVAGTAGPGNAQGGVATPSSAAAKR